MSNFTHIQTAHCENGVTVGLLNKQGLEFMNEPLALGIGSGLFYIHIPLLKINGGPAISFRSMPGSIFKRTCRALNINIQRKKFRSELAAEKFLDERLDSGNIVGCQVGVYNLPYFPVAYRFHFNAHNIIVYGREGDNYLISDPVMETTTTLTRAELSKVRFAQGALSPKGHLYYPKSTPIVTEQMIREGIMKGIKYTVRSMLYIPSRLTGVRGIKYTARKVSKWRAKLGERRAGLFLGQIVRMQEEIGTGGGGFRFMYAAFLQKASNRLQNDSLMQISEQFTKIGDLWRDSALQMSGIYKGRITAQSEFEKSAAILFEISELERKAFKDLSKIRI